MGADILLGLGVWVFLLVKLLEEIDMSNLSLTIWWRMALLRGPSGFIPIQVRDEPFVAMECLLQE